MMKKSRFTLVELMVVIIILLIIAGMTFGTIKKIYRVADEKDNYHRIQVIAAVLEEYKTEYGHYPVRDQNLLMRAEDFGLYTYTGKWKALGSPYPLGQNFDDASLPNRKRVELLWTKVFGNEALAYWDSGDSEWSKRAVDHANADQAYLTDALDQPISYKYDPAGGDTHYWLWSVGLDGKHGDNASTLRESGSSGDVHALRALTYEENDDICSWKQLKK